MTDALAPWANLGMLVVIGGVVTLVLVLVVGTADGAISGRALPQTLGALGAIAAFAAGLVVAAFAVAAPDRWWFALIGWVVWIGGEIVVVGLVAVLAGAQRRLAGPRHSR
jgi:hypothetical protein